LFIEILIVARGPTAPDRPDRRVMLSSLTADILLCTLTIYILEQADPLNPEVIGGVPDLKRDIFDVAGIELEVFESGDGPPLFLLHGSTGFDPDEDVNELFAKRRRLISPSHPGFGKSALPDWMDRIEDIAHVHLELMDRLSLRNVQAIGFSIGGWIAAEMATMLPECFSKLVLVGPVGVKTGPSDRLDVPDIFALSEEELKKILFHDSNGARVDPKTLSEEQLAIVFRNRESLALLSWEPYMHNPKLKHRLRRVTAPTLFIRGESDGFVSAQYLQSYAQLLSNSRISTIRAAGHAPHLEQPRSFAETVFAFLEP
jgi:pimeloyl-ACP methyl ester carboxylesterase